MQPNLLSQAQSLRPRGHGTEARAWALYGLVRMLRPVRLLEVGIGYTTPFLLSAIHENAREAPVERERLSGNLDRAGFLEPSFHRTAHLPRLVACDTDPARAQEVRRIAEGGGLASRLDLHVGDFRTLSSLTSSADPLFDFVFFDCGGVAEYAYFLRHFWSRISPHGGLLALDYTYWTRVSRFADGRERAMKVPGSIANELRRQLAAAGVESTFEVLSLVEPHKRDQGSLTLVRRLPSSDRLRNHPFHDDLASMGLSEPLDGFTLD